MKKRCILSILLALCLLLGAFSPAASATEATYSCSGLNAAQPLDSSGEKLDTAKVALLYEMNTQTLVYSYDADKLINPTGLVKLLTVLVALEKGDLDEMVTVYQATLNTVAIGSVSARLRAGEELTLRDLLHCIMVSSANDACAVVAAHIGGNQEGFAEMMNAKAAELGCTSSHFTNAHGLTDENQYSTARDLAIITMAALENPQFREMFALTEYTVEATNKSEVRNLKSTNNMMREDKANYDARITGGKPAAATNTDRSMICTAQVGTANYLCVVMSAKGTMSEDGFAIVRYGIYEEVSALLDYASAGFEVRQILDDSQTLYQHNVMGGENDVLLRPSTDVSVVLPKDCDVQNLHFDSMVDPQALTAPISLGQNLGTLTIRYGGLVMGTCDLLAVAAVAGEGTQIQDAQRQEIVDDQEDEQWKTILGWVAILLLVLGAVVLVLIGLIRGLRARRLRFQQRRRAKKRKRSR